MNIHEPLLFEVFHVVASLLWHLKVLHSSMSAKAALLRKVSTFGRCKIHCYSQCLLSSLLRSSSGIGCVLKLHAFGMIELVCVYALSRLGDETP